MNIAETIKLIRKKAFLSQSDFAKEIGVSFSTVNRWENGKSSPNYSALKQINAFCQRHSIDINVAGGIIL
jgi:DNA-binding transcriptional regulator YiaG